MAKRGLPCTLGVLILLIAGNTHAQTMSVQALGDIGSQYFKLVGDRDFHAVSKLFHYPKYYSKRELDNDMNGVAKTLSLLTDEFGSIEKKNIAQSPVLFYHVGVMGGDVQYWQRHPHTIKLSYDVEFEREGQGYVDINFCNINGYWQIGQIFYGLPSARHGSRARIQEILQKMMQLMQQLMQGQSTSI